MSFSFSPLTPEETDFFSSIDQESIEFLMTRYNRVNRWVIADMIRRSSYRYPDKPALIYKERTLSYAELEAESNRVAHALRDLGVQKYDRVAILAHNTTHHVLTWIACCKIGAVYLAVNYLLKGKDIAYCINHSESKVFIIEDALYGLTSEVLSDLPTVKHLVWSDDMAGEKVPDGRFKDFEAWYRPFPATEPEALLRIEEPCQMTYTSGTESLPKGVVNSNQALIAQYMSIIIDGGFEESDISINALPIYHCAQRDVFMNPIFWVGGTNILMTPDIGKILENIARYRATMFFAPPTVWIGMLRHPEFGRHDLSSLKKCYYGASIMPMEILREMLERLPEAKFANLYGQTELSPLHTLLKAKDAFTKPGSAGMGSLHMETRLEDNMVETVTVPGVPGEICGRGPHAMMMYFKSPEKTEEAMAGGWFHSGDIGIMDDERYITVVDRKKDMIKTGGENVSTREVEDAIYLDKRVEEVAVVGVNHPKWVEAVVAVVAPRKGETIPEADLVELCKKHLAPYKVPKKVIFVETLPKSPTGKLLKRSLRADFGKLFSD
jgi:fatty-acyl-CoA synthase